MRKEENRLNRESNIELLRIVAMLMVIVCHCIGWNPYFSSMTQDGSVRSIFLESLSGLGKVGVHIFFLISGYFTILKPVKAKSLAKIWIKGYLYKVLIALFAFTLLAVGYTSIRDNIFSEGVTMHFLEVFNPTTTEWWFLSTYIIIMVASPFIANVIKKVKRAKMKRFLIIFGFLFYLVSFLFRLEDPILNFDGFGTYITYLITFMVGAYIGLYKIKLSHQTSYIWAIFSYLITLAWSIAVVKFGFGTGYRYDTWNNHFTHFIMALSIFFMFLNLKINMKIINVLASYSLGVYLLHNSALSNRYLWKVFDIHIFYNSYLIYFAPFIFAVVVYLLCTMLDYVLSKIIINRVANLLT